MPVGRLETSPPVAQEELASWAVPTLCPACKGSRGVQPHKYYNTLKPGKKSSHSYAMLFSKTFRVLLALSKVRGSCAWPWKVWVAVGGPGRPGKFCREGPGRPWEALGGPMQWPSRARGQEGWLCAFLFFHKPQTCRHDPLLYSKITIRVLRAATAVPTPHIADCPI